jgi:myo-inositol-1(or 4)-monophosphatase
MKKNFTSSELEKICKDVIVLAKTTGAFIKEEAKSFDANKIEYKGANDLVSYVDKESEKKLVEGLKKILPEASFITEEGTIDRNQNELQWVVDPLDGTTNFLHGLPLYSVRIALMENDTSIIGVVYEPNQDECFYAWKNGGAFCNGKPIHVSAVTELKKSLLVMGFPYSLLHKQEDYLKIFGAFATVTQGIRRLGSAAVDLAYVAAGRLEGYYEFNLKVWDVAAGILLVQEAGGKVTDFSGGNNYRYGQEVLAAGGVHEEMRKVIARHWF